MKHSVYVSWRMSKCFEIDANNVEEAKLIAKNMFDDIDYEVDEIQDYVPGSFRIDCIID